MESDSQNSQSFQPYDVPQRDRRDAYELPVVLRRHVSAIRDRLQTFNLDAVFRNLVGWCNPVKDFTKDVTKFGFCSVFTLGKQVLVLCSPEGRAIVYLKREEDDFRLAQEIAVLLRNPNICKACLNFEETRNVVNEFLPDELGPLVSLVDLEPHVSKLIDSADLGQQNSLDFFRHAVDGRIFSLPNKFPLSVSLSQMKEEQLKALAQVGRCTIYAVWLLTYRLSGNIGLERSANMTPYTRELFWNSSYHSMVDGYYVKSEDITLKPLHKTRLNMLDECRDINLAVWKKDTPAYRLPWAEDFTYAVSGLCRSCGLSPSKAPGKTLDKHPCAGHNTCGYPFCHDTSDHSIITCDALRAWCHNCRRRGHVKTDHFSDDFSQVYADHIFRIFSLKGHDTGYVYSSEKLSENERHWRFTLYGLSSLEVPKAALEFLLIPAIPIGMRPPPPPPKKKVEKEKKKPAKGKSVVTSLTSGPSSSRSSPNKTHSLPSKSEPKKENQAKKEKKFSSPPKPKEKTPSQEVKKGRVAKTKTVPKDSLSFTKALHLAGRISRGEIVGTPTLLKDKLVQLALMQFESMKTFAKVKLTAGEDIPMVALPCLVKPTPSSTITKSPSHGEEAMEVEDVASVLPAPEVGKDTDVASSQSASGQASAKVKPIVDDLSELLNPRQVQVKASQVTVFGKLNTIPEEAEQMDQSRPAAQDVALLDRQDDEILLTYNEEDLKLLDRSPDENKQMDDNKAESEDDHFDP